jgi:short-subunit dehydrogenase
MFLRRAIRARQVNAMTIQLAGRAAIISGAGRGIGRALAERALAEGMRVHGWDVDADALDTLDPAIATTQLDVGDADAVMRAAAHVREEGLGIALVCANAGMLRVGRSWEIDPADWARLMRVNVGGVANMLAAFIPAMIEQDAPAHVLLTGSQSAFVARPGNAAYSASKHAVWGLAEALKLELDEAGGQVGVSLLAPGPVRTSLADVPGAGGVFHDALQRIGISADAVADAAFAAIRARRFWVFTHQDFKPDLAARIARLIAEEPPA